MIHNVSRIFYKHAEVNMDYKARLKAFRKELKKHNLDGFMVTNEFNRRYLSGFTGSFGGLFIDARNAWIATDSRYFIQVKNQCPDFSLLQVGKISSYDLFMKKKKLEGKKIGRNDPGPCGSGRKYKKCHGAG